MNKKRVLSIVLIVLFLIISLMNLYVISYSSSRFSSFTGDVISTGVISLIVLSPLNFSITSPLNGSVHNFNLSDGNLVDGIYEFPIDLNVTNTSEIPNWSYFVYNVDHGDYIVDAAYSPNQTVYIRAGWNNLTIAAQNIAQGLATNKSVLFHVNVSNSAPIINLTQDETIYACEGEIFDYSFTITDYDDSLDLSSLSMAPSSPLKLKLASPSRLIFSIFASRFYTAPFTFAKSEVGSYPKLISVSDFFLADSKNITIQVLEINNVPDTPTIGVRLIYRVGDDTSFNYEWVVSDVEDGLSSAGNLIFNLSYSDGSDFTLFDINNSYGVMNFTADNTTLVGTHALRTCVVDNALSSPHVNLSTSCLSDGGANVVCDDFFLTVTDSNRAPNITTHVPAESSLSMATGEIVNFSVDVYEGDFNPISLNWYVDSVLVRDTVLSDNNYYTDNFLYSFPCGVSGSHIMLVNVSDGELYDTFNWTISVDGTLCATSSDGDGGGGGGGTPWCFEDWVCEQWNECLSVHNAYDNSLVSLDDFYDYIDKCKQLGFDESVCGFQIKNCLDLKECSNDDLRVVKPQDEQSCYFVENPSCFDGVKNCHDGDCELLIDCGGSCSACATCSDGVKNQNEGGIDCGGPCPYACELEEPGYTARYVLIGLSVMIFTAGIVIMYYVYRFIMLLFGRRMGGQKEKKGKKKFALSNYQRKGKIKNLIKSVKREEEE